MNTQKENQMIEMMAEMVCDLNADTIETYEEMNEDARRS